MVTVTISQARQDLPSLINRVYAGEEFLIVKNKIPMAQISPVKKRQMKKIFKRKILPEVFGMWKNRKEWKGLSTIEIADRLRESAWKGNYGD